MQQAFSFARDAKTLVDTTEKLKDVVYELLKLTVELCIFVKEYTNSGFIGIIFTFVLFPFKLIFT